jgi:hypothetical protein
MSGAVAFSVVIVTMGSRTFHISPSPDERPLTIRSCSQSGAASSKRQRMRPHEAPLRAFADFPTKTGQICGG